MPTEPPLLFFQRRPLLPPYRTATHDHHEGLIPRLLLVRRATLHFLLFLAFVRAKRLTVLSALFNRRHALRIICLGPLPRSQDIVLRNETAIRNGMLFVGFQSRKLPFGDRPICLLNDCSGSFDFEVVYQSKVGRSKYLRGCLPESRLRCARGGVLLTLAVASDDTRIDGCPCWSGLEKLCSASAISLSLSLSSRSLDPSDSTLIQSDSSEEKSESDSTSQLSHPCSSSASSSKHSEWRDFKWSSSS